MVVVVGGLVAKSCWTLVIPRTVACQAPLSMGFSGHEYLSGLPFPSREISTQEVNLGLLHCRQMTYQLSHEGSPYIYMRLVISWTVAHQAPLSMGFSRQVLPFPSHYGWLTLLYGKIQHDIVKQLPSNSLIFLIKKKKNLQENRA